MPRSERPRRKFDLDQHRVRRRQHRRQQAWDAAEQAVDEHGRPVTAADNASRSVSRVRSGFKHLTGRPGMLIAAGAAAAGGGGLVYSRHKKKGRAGVSKLYNPFTDQTVEFGKTTGFQRHVYDSRFAGKKGKESRKDFRHETAQRAKTSVPVGAVTGTATGAALGHKFGHTKFGTGLGAVDGAALGLLHAEGRSRTAVQRKMDAKEGAASKAMPADPASGTQVRRVSPIFPRGAHVSHENDLSVTRHSRSDPIGSGLRMYRSGSKHTMTGGGKLIGHATHNAGSTRGVTKRLSTQQGAAVFAKRGTPMSDLHRQSRVGRRVH